MWDGETHFVSSNPVENYTRNNDRCYTVPHCNTEQYRHSFCPRTIVAWNHLATLVAQTVLSALNLPGLGKAPTDHHHHRCAPQPLRTKARFLDASDVCYIAWETETKFWSWVEKDPEVRRVRVRWIMKTLHAETKRALKTTTPFDQNGQSLDCWSLWEERNRISRFTGVNKQ